MRYQGNFETASANAEYRKTNTIEGHRTFLNQVAGLVGANFEGVEVRIAFGFDRDNPPDTVDVPSNQMAAEKFVECETTLEVYPNRRV